jgi:nucleotide-binding universal stress UspA family protein
MNDIGNIGPVVIATDLSERSRYALERASRLAAAGAGPCTAVLVVNGGALETLCRLMGEDTAAFETHLMQDSKAKLDQLVDEIFGSTAIDTRVVVGNVVPTLLAQADELDAGLIVVGARGGGFLRQLVLGTTTERILRKTARPVLVVRQSPLADYRRVVVAVDFSDASATGLRLALAIAPKAELVLVHAYEVPFESKLRFAGVDEPMIERYRERAEDEASKGLETFMTEVGLPPGRARLVVEQGDPTRVILDQHGCDLVVVGQRGKSAFEELLLGSVTKHVLAETNIDVLVAVPTQVED